MPAKIFNFNRQGINARGFGLRAKKGDKKAELIIYGPIGMKTWDGEGITAKEVSDAISGLDASVTELEIRINSPGGDCYDGIAIYNRIKQWKGKKTVYIDGLAASMASVIALAGDNILIGDGAQYMVHLPWTFAMGNRNELDGVINLLMDIEEQMTTIYSKNSGLDRTQVKKLMEESTWMDADQAIEKGFVHSKVEDSMPIAASVLNKSAWLGRIPTGVASQVAAVDQYKADLKKKIDGTLARK